MNNVFKGLIVVFFALFLSSCGETPLESLEKQTFTFEDFFEQVSSMNIELESENIIYIDYQWNKETNLITILNIREQEPHLFLIPFENLKNKKAEGPQYIVECDNGDDSWTGGCSSKISCAKLIGKCLEAGGCASICNNRMAYDPRTTTFYLFKD